MYNTYIIKDWKSWTKITSNLNNATQTQGEIKNIHTTNYKQSTLPVQKKTPIEAPIRLCVYNICIIVSLAEFNLEAKAFH